MNVMAGNLSVRRDKALQIGGFDENFIGVAYRFETEFAHRIWAQGGKILFQPEASIHHLRAPSGGTRSHGNHLTSVSPLHGVGDFYFALRQGLSLATLIYMARRPFREVCTRFHLKHPWWIPVKFLGEIRALLLAIRLRRQGPRYVACNEKQEQP
jgi:GT2 family glycosyltransferase